MNTKTLSEKAMLVSLNISVWDRFKFDAKVSDEVAVQHNTNRNAGRYNKNLLPFNPVEYKTVTALAGEARQIHYSHTLPWSDNGARILPCANWQKYTDKVRGVQTRFNIAVQEFVIESPRLFSRALTELNGLGNPADFPSTNKLQGSFDFSVKFFPFPSADDFRVTLQPSHVQAIQADIEQHVSETIRESMRDQFKRLHGVVSRMVETLSNVDAVFRDTLVTNIESLLDVLPALNLTNDPALDTLCNDIRAALVVDPDTLRYNKLTRASIVLKAKLIQDNLATFMG